MWQVTPSGHKLNISTIFPTLANVFNFSQGKLISQSSLSNVIKYTYQDTVLYIKRYTHSGKSLRRFMGRSRVQGEWENLLYFASLHIPTAPILAYGQAKHFGIFQGGALITEEIPNTRDLAKLAISEHPCLRNNHWVKQVMQQIARYTARLHRERFIHGDLKWRNILIGQAKTPVVYFIDCPIGRKRRGYFFHRGQSKDLYHLDQFACQYLTERQRLRFFYMYCKYIGKKHLDRKLLKHIQERERR